jgi:solute carrier family 50 protein (sugar transporter)
MGIVAEGSVGKLSLLPFASLLTNCIIWFCYGLLKDDFTVMIPNGLGIFSGLFCFASYVRFSKGVDATSIAVSLALILLALSLYSAGDYNTLGSIGCILAMILMGSPLSTLSTVIRDKSTKSMPFGTSFATWCNAFSWSLYGLVVAKDFMVRRVYH